MGEWREESGKKKGKAKRSILACRARSASSPFPTAFPVSISLPRDSWPSIPLTCRWWDKTEKNPECKTGNEATKKRDANDGGGSTDQVSHTWTLSSPSSPVLLSPLCLLLTYLHPYPGRNRKTSRYQIPLTRTKTKTKMRARTRTNTAPNPNPTP